MHLRIIGLRAPNRLRGGLEMKRHEPISRGYAHMVAETGAEDSRLVFESA
jgi:hypothetical protein